MISHWVMTYCYTDSNRVVTVYKSQDGSYGGYANYMIIGIKR